MVGPEYAAVLDPFSKEGKRIAKEAPAFNSFPQEIIDLAVQRIKNRSGSEAKVKDNKEAIHADVLSFYLMCQAVASVSYPYSPETRLVTDSVKETIQYRMWDLFRHGEEQLCMDVVQQSFRVNVVDENGNIKNTRIPKEDLMKIRERALRDDNIKIVDGRALPQYDPKYALRWTDFGPLLQHRKTDLTKLYIVDGWAVITPRELWRFFADHIVAMTEDYIASLCEKFGEMENQPPVLTEVGERISKLVPEEKKNYEFVTATRGPLQPECFPPCIHNTLKGVGAGSRNYAITVLLTSFLSRARAPTPSGKRDLKMAQFIENIDVLEKEIMPLIIEAAENCRPPFFRDQPQEKGNVYYHMGFGLTTTPKMSDSGRSKWYSTPNCSKIQTAAPHLCTPDELCSKITNPLTYYYRKKRDQSTSRGA